MSRDYGDMMEIFLLLQMWMKICEWDCIEDSFVTTPHHILLLLSSLSSSSASNGVQYLTLIKKKIEIERVYKLKNAWDPSNITW